MIETQSCLGIFFNFKLRLAIVFCATFALACGKKGPVATTSEEENLTQVDGSVPLTLAQGLSALSGAAAVMSQASNLARSHTPSLWERFHMIPRAHAELTGCSELAVNDLCTAGARSAKYTGCLIPGTALKLSGTVHLEYSQTACTFATNGDLITRTLELQRDDKDSATVRITSEGHRDYRDNFISGGTRIARTDTGYSLSILGMRRIKSFPNGNKVYDISVRSTGAMALTDPTAASVTINGATVAGGVEIAHNLSKFAIKALPSQVVLEPATCCHPTSGSVALEFSGSLSGTATLKYLSTCGEVLLTRDGSTTQTTLGSW